VTDIRFSAVTTDVALRRAPLDEGLPRPQTENERGRHVRNRAEYFERICSGPLGILIGVLVATWLASLVSFWLWWLQPSHQVSITRTSVVAALLIYVTVVLPAPAAFYLLRLRRLNSATVSPDLRVAMAVTKAPSEPWELVVTTLEAMQSQSFSGPYDVWLCDENPDDVTKQWCVDHGVRLSSRYGVSEYHQPSWPRRTKCKEGNLAYFYDHWGYDEYDVVVQLDADHVPSNDYLKAMVRPFGSWTVGYVAAPSICDLNAAASWAARGRLHSEASMHGPRQIGCNDGLAPVCIGSHYAVRTSALREIGGLGPELAEDFTTSFLLTSAGWEGAFALDAEAHGEGPPTFTALAVQEFQWSQSLTVVGLRMYLKHFRRFRWRLKVRFGLHLMYYPMLVITTLAGVLLSPIAVLTGEPWMNVNYFEFLGRLFLLALPFVIATLILRRRGFLRPVNAKVLCWEVWLFSFARWPYAAIGFLSGVKERITSKSRTIKVTPKGIRGLEVLSIRFILPYLVVSTVALGAVWARSGNPAVRYYVVLCLVMGSIYVLVALIIAFLHAVEAKRGTQSSWFAALGTIRGALLVASVLAAAWVCTIIIVAPHALTIPPPPGMPPR
jgi:cellulose synthase (UDP-forming)